MRDPPTMITGADVRSFVAFRRESGDSLFAVVDAARDRALAFNARDEFGLEARWLFHGDTPATGTSEKTAGSRKPFALADQFEATAQSRLVPVAPYVVAVPMGGRDAQSGRDFLSPWADRLGTSAGILLLAPVALDALARHLRSVFHATDEQYHKYFFRFYDPRVLRPFLPTCNPRETQQFFGPIKCILVEAEDSGDMIVAHPTATGVQSDQQRIGRDDRA